MTRFVIVNKRTQKAIDQDFIKLKDASDAIEKNSTMFDKSEMQIWEVANVYDVVLKTNIYLEKLDPRLTNLGCEEDEHEVPEEELYEEDEWQDVPSHRGDPK